MYRQLHTLDPERDYERHTSRLSEPAPAGDGRCTHSTARHASSSCCSLCMRARPVRVAPGPEGKPEPIALKYRTARGPALAAGLV